MRDDDARSLMDQEVAMARQDGAVMNAPDRPGVPSGFACPDCSGVLFEIHEGGLRRFRCRVGHAWSPIGLAAQQTMAVESALWMALRALEEKAALADRMCDNARSHSHAISAHAFATQAAEARSSALVLRDLIESSAALMPEDGTDVWHVGPADAP